jgi:hypothetical protein
MIVLAHVGHWLTSAIYLAPVAVVGGFVGVQGLRDRRARLRAQSS